MREYRHVYRPNCREEGRQGRLRPRTRIRNFIDSPDIPPAKSETPSHVERYLTLNYCQLFVLRFSARNMPTFQTGRKDPNLRLLLNVHHQRKRHLMFIAFVSPFTGSMHQERIGCSLSVNSPDLTAKPEPPHVATGACHTPPSYHQRRHIQKSPAMLKHISFDIIVNSLF